MNKNKGGLTELTKVMKSAIVASKAAAVIMNLLANNISCLHFQPIPCLHFKIL